MKRHYAKLFAILLCITIFLSACFRQGDEAAESEIASGQAPSPSLQPLTDGKPSSSADVSPQNEPDAASTDYLNWAIDDWQGATYDQRVIAIEDILREDGDLSESLFGVQSRIDGESLVALVDSLFNATPDAVMGELFSEVREWA